MSIHSYRFNVEPSVFRRSAFSERFQVMSVKNPPKWAWQLIFPNPLTGVVKPFIMAMTVVEFFTNSFRAISFSWIREKITVKMQFQST